MALFAITIKAHSEAGWDGFIDVFGNPALFFEYPPGTSDEKAAEYDEIMFKLLGDGRGGYPAGGKIVPVETTATGGVTFQDRAVFANKKMIMRATGAPSLLWRNPERAPWPERRRWKCSGRWPRRKP